MDEICNDYSITATPTKTRKNLTLNSKNTKIYQNTKRILIDPKKKVKLLADLKAIDSNESFDS